MLTLEELKRELRPLLAPRDGREAWFDALALRLEHDCLMVRFPHSYFARWFSMYKQASFENALSRRFPNAPGIIYENMPDRHAFRPAILTSTRNIADAATALGPKASAPKSESTTRPSVISDEDPFSHFIVNARNAFPLATAKKISREGMTGEETVLVFCGKSGTGKTQLLQAMATTLAHRLNTERVFLWTAAQFCSDIIDTPRAKDFWQNYDALLLDDLQDIVDEPHWQRHLATYMDTPPDLHLQNMAWKKIPRKTSQTHSRRLLIFAYAGSAAELTHLEERLRTRLERGLVLELLEPDLDVRIRYLQRAVHEHELPLSRDQILYLAQRCMQFSLLQGLLRKVEAFTTHNGRAPLQADLENIVRTGGSMRPVGCREILASVARSFNLRGEDILGARRRPDLVLARQVAMYLCRRKLGLSYPELGRAFGGRDHSTVIHAVKKIRKLLDTDKVVHSLVTELENTVP